MSSMAPLTSCLGAFIFEQQLMTKARVMLSLGQGQGQPSMCA